MAISFVDVEGAGGGAGTIDMDLLTYSEDDLLIGCSTRGNTSGTGTPTGYTDIVVGTDEVGAAGYLKASHKIAVATESDPVWSSAARVLVASYRGHDGTDPIGDFDAAGNGNTIPALTLEVTDGSSWVVVLCTADSNTNPLISGMTRRFLLDDTFALFDTNGGVSSFAGGSVTNMGDVRAVVGVFEVKAAAGGGAAVALAGSAAGSSTASGVLSLEVPLSGTSDGDSTATGVLSKAVPLAASADGSSTAQGVLSTGTPLAGSAAGGSTASGSLSLTVGLSGTSDGQAAANGNLTVEGAGGGPVDLQGSSGGTSTASGSLSLGVALSGLSEGSSTAQGVLERAVSLSGASNGASTTQGALSVLVALEGLSEGSSTGTGKLTLGVLAKPPRGPTHASFVSASGTAVTGAAHTSAEWRP